MIGLYRTPLSLLVIAVLSVMMVVQAESSSPEPVEHVVKITRFKFVPDSLSVKAGDTVTWINADLAPHTATANDMSFDTGELKQNESGSITFTSDQTISYFCKYHPMMKASLMLE